LNSPDLTTEFAEYDRKVRIRNSRLGAVWAMILMPAGFTLDWFVYPRHWELFLGVRLLCSFLVWIVRLLFNTPFGERHYRALGMIWYLLPALAISWMIYASGDPASPYYAGLNIVLIGAGLFLPWTSRENLLAWGLVMAMYAGACLLLGWPAVVGKWNDIFNNLYFLILTGLIVVIASYYHSGTRYREFALRFELDRNKHVLEEANQRLKDLDEAKSRFFANISHELRTPLTLLLAPLESIRQKRDVQLDAQTRDWLDTMHANGMRLLKLINDLLDLVRLESGQMQLRPETFSVPELVKGLVSAVHKMADDKRVKLRTEIADSVGDFWADRDKLEKIFLNLLFNAIKFTPGGGEIIFGVNRTTDNGLRFVVKDTGVGIAADDLPIIFEPFVQVGRDHRLQEGTGLGLPISRRFARLLGGDLTAASAGVVGQGSRFVLEIPVSIVDGAGAGAATARRAARLAPDQQDYRLLVVDDRAESRRLLGDLLARMGFAVRTAENGAEALLVWEEWQPHLIWMDLQMPVMDGRTAARRIKATAQGQRTVVIAVSAGVPSELHADMLADGCDDFIRKPFREEEIVNCLVRHLGVALVYTAPPVAAPSTTGWEGAPAEWRRQVQQAAAAADVMGLRRLAASVEEEQPQLAAALRSRLGAFDYAGILAACAADGGKATQPGVPGISEETAVR